LAVIGLVEAAAISKSIAEETGQKLESNREFLGQGLGNFVGSFFSCFAGSGSFTRSAINLDSGARTPLAAVITSAIIAVAAMFFGSLSSYLSVPALAGVIIVVGGHLVKVSEIKKVAHLSNKDFAVLLSTFLATIIVSLESAIYLGVILSLFFALQRLATPLVKLEAPDPDNFNRRFYSLERRPELQQCPQLKIVRIDGGVFFGSVDQVESVFNVLREDSRKHMLLNLKGLTFLDLEACKLLEAEAERRKEMGGALYISGMKQNTRDFLERAEVAKVLDSESFFQTKGEAITQIIPKLNEDKCLSCKARVFRECHAFKAEGI